MKFTRHRDGDISLRMKSRDFADLIDGAQLAWIHWMGVAERSLLTGASTLETDRRIRDEYKSLYEELIRL